MRYENSDPRVRMTAFRLLHLVARRGNSREFPENTLPALRSAIELGARFIEIDVHMASDGVPMVVHDRALAQVAGFIDMPAAQLAGLDVGHPVGPNTGLAGGLREIRLASLASTLSLLDGRPELTIFVVIGRASAARYGHEQVVSQIARVLQPFRSRCVLASLDLPTVHAARGIAGFPIAWMLPTYNDHTRLKYETLQPEYLFCDHTYLPRQQALWRGPWRWVVYEVDTLDLVLELAQLGADFVATKDVRSLSESMRAHAAGNLRAKDSSFRRS
jgi:glycerophosphoryl diester phosphodiesterase